MNTQVDHAKQQAQAPAMLEALKESTSWLEVALRDLELPYMFSVHLTERIEANKAVIAAAETKP